ncbi:DNA-protecting protein DprA [Candidatus Uhrbacteria bacterium]|jgi:DNA processing protein|nr:DNA-protecting protein DprA [Candidatus Uhrbacteria bacterium]MBT7716777.1 DNA-protecting protein DprA [Candidatus Uhrbacteria bacterium]
MIGEENLACLIALNEFPKFGPRRMQRLFKVFDTSRSIFESNATELRNAGIPETVAKEFIEFRKTINLVELLELVQTNDMTVISIFDENFPTLLKEIYDPPTLLYIKGELPDLSNRKLLGIVGSRKASPYGAQVAKDLTQDIARAGIITVSGLAYGIDGIAHKATIDAKGQTIAVLGFGILHEPSSREQVIQNHIIENGGCIISEFPLMMHGAKQNFPIRNRIISGISHGTLVVEAAIKSGSLITARSAMEQNREVFAVPGPINSQTSEGTNQLIKDGAHMVTKIEDILGPLEIDRIVARAKTKTTPQGDTPQEDQILSILSKQPTHIDDITRTTNLPAPTVASTISILELKSLVQNVGGERYYLN